MECIIDTHILADLLKQYNSGRPNQPLQESKFISKRISHVLNQFIQTEGYNGVIVASTFAFIEILNKFNEIAQDAFDLKKVVGILSQPPDWFVIEPFSGETNRQLISVPKINTNGENIELADAIHVATALQRGPNTMLATHDQTLRNLDFASLNIIHLI